MAGFTYSGTYPALHAYEFTIIWNYIQIVIFTASMNN